MFGRHPLADGVADPGEIGLQQRGEPLVRLVGGVVEAHLGAGLCRHERRTNSLGMRELLRTNDPTVLAFATALLDGEGIDCFPIDVNMSVLEGSIGILPRRLMVR